MAVSAGGSIASAEADPQAVQFFETSVRPLLIQHCYECHSLTAPKVQAGLLMDSRQGLLVGGDSGPSLVPKDPDRSLIIEAVRYESYEMPPTGKLSDQDIRTLEQWVAMGAPWPEEEAPTAAGNHQPKFDLQQRRADHWAWQPISPSHLPAVNDVSWPADPLDHYILAKLEKEELRPAGDVDRSALLRRLYFDLIGLPPTPDQLRVFLDDTSPTATQQVVDELLLSPHFGERWGRHWLDLVRYAESRGHEFDNDSPNAFQYRDYIIRAFNSDVPYDQLVREHIAGDLISPARLNPTTGFNESILGTGFWFLGEWTHSPVDIRREEADRFDNMVDVMSKTFLGMTVACARCHDHKFDAISTADYYSLCGFLQSSDYRQVRFESIEHNRNLAEQLSRIDEEFQANVQREMGKQGVPDLEIPPLPEEVRNHLIIDFGSIHDSDFLQDGFTFGSAPRRAGQPVLNDGVEVPAIQWAEFSGAVSDPFWDGLISHSETSTQNRGKLFDLPRSGRTLRTPTFELSSGDLACRVRGSGHVVACVDSHRLVAGPLHGQTIKPIQPGDDWVELNLQDYAGHRVHLEFNPDIDASLAVSFVLRDATPAVRQQVASHEVATQKRVSQRSEAVTQSLSNRLASIATAWAEARSELRSHVDLESHLAMAMMDGSGEDDRILIRGNSSQPGEIEPRHFLTAISGDRRLTIKSGSGRLELADQINDPTNPLTSRVMVNRIWHHLMGRGIVPTTDDFGVLGQPPTHPELLDHLANQFLQSGQSIKRMIRTLVLSRTYRMSSQYAVRALEIDPTNSMWHHKPPKRLEGESIRDAILLIAGQLDASAFGPSVPIHLTDFMDGRGRPAHSGPLDGDGRRSIYSAVRRNFLPPFMLAFDTPTPFSTMGRRNVSNVPAQALILMNHPLIVELADRWAERAIQNSHSTESRIQWMYRSAFARPPTDRELSIAAEYVATEIGKPHEGIGDEVVENQVWAALAHALINMKEFIFVR